ncbi:MAG TPA: hypothetical protein VFO31_30655 [Vicinamibacterales bacterium]|nr:hypothetical protein [Vicinamibacterales bacterium]
MSARALVPLFAGPLMFLRLGVDAASAARAIDAPLSWLRLR